MRSWTCFGLSPTPPRSRRGPGAPAPACRFRFPLICGLSLFSTTILLPFQHPGAGDPVQFLARRRHVHDLAQPQALERKQRVPNLPRRIIEPLPPRYLADQVHADRNLLAAIKLQQAFIPHFLHPRHNRRIRTTPHLTSYPATNPVPCGTNPVPVQIQIEMTLLRVGRFRIPHPHHMQAPRFGDVAVPNRSFRIVGPSIFEHLGCAAHRMNIFTTEHPLTSQPSWFDTKAHPRLSFVCRAFVLAIAATPIVLIALIHYVMSDLGAETTPSPGPDFSVLVFASVFAFAISLLGAFPIVLIVRMTNRNSKT